MHMQFHFSWQSLQTLCKCWSAWLQAGLQGCRSEPARFLWRMTLLVCRLLVSRRFKYRICLLIMVVILFWTAWPLPPKEAPHQVEVATPKASKDVCSSRYRSCQLKALSEIERNVDRIGTFSNDNCSPNIIKLPYPEGYKPFKAKCVGDIVIEQYDFHTQYDCLMEIAKRAHQSSSTVIPRIGHAVYYYGPGSVMKFHHHISMLSLVRYLKPTAFFFWNDGLPSGRWWTELLFRLCPRNAKSLSEVPLSGDSEELRFYSIYRKRPKSIYGRRINRVEHGSDVVRLEALLLIGGVYLDFDAFAVNNLAPLLNDSWVQGYEAAKRLSNSVLLGAQNASFGTLWHCEYARDFNDSQWLDHSVIRPHEVAERCPLTIRRENASLCKPSNYPDGNGMQLLYADGVYFNLSLNYAVHTFMWVIKRELDLLDPDYVSRMNTTLGRILRAVYYDLPLE